jgi:hypothetical protein
MRSLCEGIKQIFYWQLFHTACNNLKVTKPSWLHLHNKDFKIKLMFLWTLRLFLTVLGSKWFGINPNTYIDSVHLCHIGVNSLTIWGLHRYSQIHASHSCVRLRVERTWFEELSVHSVLEYKRQFIRYLYTLYATTKGCLDTVQAITKGYLDTVQSITKGCLDTVQAITKGYLDTVQVLTQNCIAQSITQK